MEQSLTKTLAVKEKLSVPKIYQKYQATFREGKKCFKVLQTIIEREGKKPLVARWGGISLHWDSKAPIRDQKIFLGPSRSELEKRLLASTCEYCGATGDATHIEVHHIRALKDLKAYDGREKPAWVKIMAAAMPYLVGLPSYQNLGEALEGVLARHLAAHRTHLAQESRATPLSTAQLGPPPKLSPKAAQQSQAKREERLAQYQHVVALRKLGFSQTAIAAQVGIGHATVSRWLERGTFPEQQPRPRKTGLDSCRLT
jgi:hypothetical protein